jgi:hypothetical protein
MAITTGYQQQQPLHASASVRSAPSPQHGAHLNCGPAARPGPRPIEAEPRPFGPPREH